MIWFFALACVPSLPDYTGSDNPDFDHDRDGQTENQGDCEPQDPGRWLGAPEYCDGRWNDCGASDSWTSADEAGTATFIGLDEVPVEWAGALDADGALTFCPGTHEVELTVEAPLSLDILGLGDGVILSGGKTDPVLTVDHADARIQVTDLELNDGSGEYGGGLGIEAGTVELLGVTLINNLADFGGAIYNNGTLFLDNVSIIGAYANGELGGGIYNAGELNARAVSITGSFARLGAEDYTGGGGIYNIGNAVLERLTVADNNANWGGGIYNDGTLVLDSSTIRGSRAQHGSGFYNGENASATLTTVTIVENQASFKGKGAGIENTGTLELSQSSLVANFSDDMGGGLLNAKTGVLIANEVVVSGNYANEGGGVTDEGISTWTDCDFLSNFAVRGGALYVRAGQTELFDVAIWGNRATSQDKTSGGGILVYDGQVSCTGSGEKVLGWNPDDPKPDAMAIALNEAPLWGGAIHVWGTGTYESTNCKFGSQGYDNFPVDIYTNTTQLDYVLGTFIGALACTASECTCDGVDCNAKP